MYRNILFQMIGGARAVSGHITNIPGSFSILLSFKFSNLSVDSLQFLDCARRVSKYLLTNANRANC